MDNYDKTLFEIGFIRQLADYIYNLVSVCELELTSDVLQMEGEQEWKNMLLVF